MSDRSMDRAEVSGLFSLRELMAEEDRVLREGRVEHPSSRPPPIDPPEERAPARGPTSVATIAEQMGRGASERPPREHLPPARRRETIATEIRQALEKWHRDLAAARSRERVYGFARVLSATGAGVLAIVSISAAAARASALVMVLMAGIELVFLALWGWLALDQRFVSASTHCRRLELAIHQYEECLDLLRDATDVMIRIIEQRCGYVDRILRPGRPEW